MDNILKKTEELREKFLRTRSLLDIDSLVSESNDLKRAMNDKDFWSDQSEAVRVSRRVEELDGEVVRWEALGQEIRELEEIIAVADNEEDNSLETEVVNKLASLEKKFSDLEFLLLFSEKYDQNNAVLSIHAGTGGVDAQDWAEILERMYLRFFEKKNWQIELLDRTIANEAGIKNVSFLVRGRFAYGYLKSESGTHRLVRISPFDGDKARHTSFALVEVIPELPEAKEIEIKDEDIKIDVFRSSGPGGQGVNTTDSAVRITHLPTKLTVSCQAERSQHQNKEKALDILKSKLYKLEQEEQEKKEKSLKGDLGKAEWGQQIRSYVMEPYQLVRDDRSGHKTSQIDDILDGDLEELIESYLRFKMKK